MKIIKPFWLILGFFFIVLGIIGILLPVVPQVPFFIAAAFCFSKGSKRIHKWICKTKIYQKYRKIVKENRKKKRDGN